MNCYSSIIEKEKLQCFSLDGTYHLSKDKNSLPNSNLFLWDRKSNYLPPTYIDVKDLCNFYRVFSLEDAKKKWKNINCEEYAFRKQQIRSVVKSFKGTNINIGKLNLIQMIPEKIMTSYLESEVNLISSIVEQFQKEEWYKDLESFLLSDRCKTNVLSKMKYEINTATGPEKVDLTYQSNFRMKSLPGTCSLFTMLKTERKDIVPWPDHKLYTADFRQFEIRTLLKMCKADIDFSKGEIYEDIGKQFNLDKDNVKQQVIAYSYGQENEKLEDFIDKYEILNNIDDEYYEHDNMPVIIQRSDPDNIKVHTATQTISQYVFLQKLDKVMNLLDNKQSRFIFPLHDCVILSIHPEEMGLIDDLKNILEDDTYKIKQHLGDNLDEMVEI